MPEIVLATLNAKYPHAAFGLRYLFANMGELQSQTVLREFTIQQSPLEMVEALLREEPCIIGFGVYIWNVEPTTAVVSALKRLRPDVTIVLGGPEVSFADDAPPVCDLADYVITGEADFAFAALCRDLRNGKPQLQKWIHPPTLNLAELALPYELYTDDDLAHRVLYVEASRGCPFTCEFCLSALDIPVRQFPLESFLAAMQRLLDRGARTFKFVDRTFNLNLRVSRAILEFFWEQYTPGMFLHFEMIPDRFPEALRELVTRFPPGAIQFEVGIQTWNDDVAVLISRKQDNAAAEGNLRWLREQTGVHVHADLIVGLPGEDRKSFAAGFDRLVALRPQEIQVGILKRLRGTPIIRHDAQYQMIYSEEPPYEILQTADIPFDEM
ncbi:MAG TPA: radical SAM protein, partial [Planctomycetaceae bacterium]|nr:radical SAM protein [Planctomycetaceae bacterium]